MKWPFDWSKHSRSADGTIQRDERHPAEIPIHLRWAGEAAWKPGKTANISRSGFYFRSVGSFSIGMPIEIRLVAPAPFGRDEGKLVQLRARVVRTTPPTPKDYRSTVAVKFSKYQILDSNGNW